MSATYTWNSVGSGLPTDGGGVWNTTSTEWYGSSDVVWPNTATNTALFGDNSGAAGTVTVSGSLTTNGIIFNAASSGNYTLTGGTIGLLGTSPSIVANVPATINSALGGTGSLTKTGTGTLTLGGNNFFPGVTTVSGGTLTYAGNSSYSGNGTFLVGSVANVPAVINFNSPGQFNFSATSYVGDGTNTAGAMNVTSGVLTYGYTTANYIYLGDGTGAYGSLNLSGGTVQGTASDNGIQVGASSGFGSLVMTGGSLSITKVFYVGNGGTGVATLTGGTCSQSVTTETYLGQSGGKACINMGTEAGGNALFNNNFAGIEFDSGNSILNLNAGTLAFNAGTYGIKAVSGITGAIFNANGGVISLGANTITDVTDASTFSTYAYKGGLHINTQTFNTTLLNPVLQASGSGIYTSTIPTTASGGSGYIGAPLVGVADTTNGSATGATAVANVSNGVVTGITLTCPGQNYNVGDVLTFTFTGGGASTLASSYSYTLQASDLAANTGGLSVTGSGVLTIGAATNTYAGLTTISGGTVAFASGASLGAGGTLINGGNLALTNDANLGAVPSNPTTNITIGSGGTLSAVSSFALSANRGVALADSAAYINVGTGATLSYGGILGIAAGSTQGSLTKIGNGQLELSGSNVYSGTTTVSSGQLKVDGSLVASGSVNVLGGASLGGSGSVGFVTVANNGTIDVSQNPAGSALTMAALNFASSGVINLNAPSTTSLPINAGNLSLNGGTASVQIDFPNPNVTSGTYRLIGYNGTLSPSLSSDFTLLGLQSGGRIRNQIQINAAAHEIDLSISGDYPIWTGAQNGNWTTQPIGGAMNWQLANAGTPTDYIEGDNVLFSDLTTGTPSVSISTANVRPTTVTFSNSATGYTISGPFGIAGTGSLTVNGAGTVTITSSNSYSGPTTLSSGQLNINSSSAIGSGTFVIGGGTIDNTSGAAITLSSNNPQTWGANVNFNGTNDLNLGSGSVTLTTNATVIVKNGNLTVSGPIGGPGYSLTKNGPGNLNLGGSNTYSAGTTVLAGTLTAASNNALGSGPVTMNASSPAVLAFTSAAPSITSFSDNGVTNSTILLGNATLGSSTALTIGGNNSSSTINAAIYDQSSSNSTAIGALVKAGSGSLTLTTNVSTYSGGTTIGNGTVLVSQSSIPASGTVTSGPLGTGSIILAGGTLLPNPSSGAKLGNAIVVANGTNSTIDDNTGSDLTLYGAITGGGTLSTGGAISDSVWLYGDMSGFTGTVNFSDNATGVNLRLGGAANNASQTTFVLSGATTGRAMFWVGAASSTVQLGALSGTGGLLGGTTYNTVLGTTYAIGALGTNTTFSGVISDGSTPGNVAIAKVGTGSLTLKSANAYGGGTTVSAGTLQLGNAAALGTGTLTANGGVLDLAGYSPAVPAFSGSAGLVTNNGAANSTLSVNSTQAGVFGGSILPGASGNGIALLLSNTGGLTLTGTSTVLSAGVAGSPLEVDGMLTSQGSLGFSSGGQLAGSGTINLSSTMGLSYASGATSTFGGTLAGIGGVTVSAGQLTLSGSSMDTGVTNVTGGLLNVNGSLLSTGSLNVAAGGRLGGSGSVGITTVANSGTIDVSQNPVGSTLSLASLTFNGTSGTVNVNPLNTSSLDVSIGSLTANGGPGSIDINVPGLQLTSGTYQLLGYLGATGSTGSSSFTVTHPTVGGRESAQVLYSTIGNVHEVELVVAGDVPVWTGAQNGNWDTTTQNWNLLTAQTPTNYIEGDTVLFNDTTGATTISISGTNVHPTSVTFNNDTSTNYTITGPFSIAGSGSVAINGSGTVTIANTNTYTGATTISGGQLNINSSSAIGTGRLVIGGGTLDNTSGAPITLTTNNPQAWNADIYFNGSSDLNLGTGAVALGASRTVTVDSGNLTVGGPIGGVGMSLTKNGTGTLILNGSNDITGPLNLLAGELVLNGANAFASPLNLNAGTLNFAGGASLGSGTSAVNFNGGTLQYGLGNKYDLTTAPGVVTLATNGGTIDTNGNNVTFANGIGGVGNFTKAGLGTLTLDGTMTYQGDTHVVAGTLLYNGATSTVSQKLLVGYDAFESAAVIQTSGNLAFTATPTRDVLSIGGGGYGYYEMDGGTLNTTELAVGGRYVVGTSGAGDPNSTAVLNVKGGVISVSSYIVCSWFGTSGFAGTGLNAVINVSGGTVNNASANDVTLDYGGSYNTLGVINLLGSGAVLNATGGANGKGVNLAYSNGGNPGNNAGGFLNLNGGRFITNYVQATDSSTPTYLGFSGGTLQANSANSNFIKSLTEATIYSGGATIDSAGNNITIGQPLLAPTGSGVTSIAVSGGGAGYIGTPAVRIIGDGQGASAIAQVDLNPASPTYGQVIGIVITSPGSGYTTAAVTLFGGGATTPATLDPATLSSIVGGGLTKVGSGVLTLAAANTYSGNTVVNQGEILLGNASALGAGGLTANSGTVDLAGFSPSVTSLSGSTGLITNSIVGSLATLTVNGDSTTTFGGSLADGAGTLALSTSGGMLTLAGTNLFSGGTTVASGTLILNGAASLLAGSSLTIGTAVSPGAVFTMPGGSPNVVPLSGNAAALTPVPEPGTMALLVAALVLIFCRKRTKMIQSSIHHH